MTQRRLNGFQDRVKGNRRGDDRTFSLSQMSNAELTRALPWRDLTTNREQYQARLNIAEVRRKKTKSIFVQARAEH